MEIRWIKQSIFIVAFLLAVVMQPQKFVKAASEEGDGCTPIDVVFIVGGDTEVVEWVFDAFAMQHITRCTSSQQVNSVGVVSTMKILS